DPVAVQGSPQERSSSPPPAIARARTARAPRRAAGQFLAPAACAWLQRRCWTRRLALRQAHANRRHSEENKAPPPRPARPHSEADQVAERRTGGSAHAVPNWGVGPVRRPLEGWADTAPPSR